MFARVILIYVIPMLVGFYLYPRGTHELDLQGRLILAPPHFVRAKLFDAEFIAPLAQASRSGEFFYPLAIREEGERSGSTARRDKQYAREVNQAHARFESKLRVVENSVSHISIQIGSILQGQTLLHKFSFSEMAGLNGTSTIFEYYKRWDGARLIHALQKNNLFTEWIGHGLEGRIDAETVDGFVNAVQTAWERD